MKKNPFPSSESKGDSQAFAGYWNSELSRYSTEQILRWTCDMFSPKLVVGVSSSLSCSVMFAMLARLGIDAPIYYTGGDVVHAETVGYLTRLEKTFGKKVIPLPHKLKRESSPNIDSVYHLNEGDDEPVSPFALGKTRAKRYEGWICGARLERRLNAVRVPFLEWDDHFGLFRVAPLARWDRNSLWNMIRKESIPYNPLYMETYETTDSGLEKALSYVASYAAARRHSPSG